MSNTCSLCNSTYVWPADLKRHLKNKHGQQKSTFKQQRYTPEQQQQPYIPQSSSIRSHIPQSSSSSSHIHRLMKKNPIIFWKPIIRFCFGFPINTIPIISCHGSIRLPVWSRDLQAVENPSLSGDSYTISNTWWPQYRIASCGVMENTKLYKEP